MLACLYDVHGNLPALEAVLADARRRGATRWLLGGDLALMGAWPRETVEALRALDNVTFVRGNADRWIVDPPADDDLRAAVAACREKLGDELAQWLGDLPHDAVIDGTRFVHASPVSDLRSFLPQAGDDEAELLDGVGEARLVFGHFHIQFRRASEPAGTELVNPGSVGIPLDGDHRSAYATIEDDGTLGLHRVEYDWERSAAALYETFGTSAWTQQAHRRITRASF